MGRAQQVTSEDLHDENKTLPKKKHLIFYSFLKVKAGQDIIEINPSDCFQHKQNSPYK